MVSKKVQIYVSDAHKLLILQYVVFTFCVFCAFLRLYQEQIWRV